VIAEDKLSSRREPAVFRGPHRSATCAATGLKRWVFVPGGGGGNRGRRGGCCYTLDRGLFRADMMRQIDAPVVCHFVREEVRDVE